jgi:Tfp pilus assembly protein PilF
MTKEEYYDQGMAYLGAGRVQEAINAGKRAVEINPNDILAHTSLSMRYMKTRQPVAK